MRRLDFLCASSFSNISLVVSLCLLTTTTTNVRGEDPCTTCSGLTLPRSALDCVSTSRGCYYRLQGYETSTSFCNTKYTDSSTGSTTTEYRGSYIYDADECLELINLLREGDNLEPLSIGTQDWRTSPFGCISQTRDFESKPWVVHYNSGGRGTRCGSYGYDCWCKVQSSTFFYRSSFLRFSYSSLYVLYKNLVSSYYELFLIFRRIQKTDDWYAFQVVPTVRSTGVNSKMLREILKL